MECGLWCKWALFALAMMTCRFAAYSVALACPTDSMFSSNSDALEVITISRSKASALFQYPLWKRFHGMNKARKIGAGLSVKQVERVKVDTKVIGSHSLVFKVLLPITMCHTKYKNCCLV